MRWLAIVCVIIFATHVLSLYGQWLYTTIFRSNHVCWNVRSEKLFRQGCTRVKYPIWLRGRVHISVNVLCRVAAKLAAHSAVNVIIWPFSVLSCIPIVGVGYCIK